MIVDYRYAVVVPSLHRRVYFRELTVRELININKSIMNGHTDQIIMCFDQIIEACCAEKGLLFTLLDKIIILLNIRANSVSTFCEITIVDKEEGGKEFKHTLEVARIINNLLQLPVEYKKTFNIGNEEIVYGIPLQPVENVNIIVPADYIHSISVNGEILTGLNKADTQTIVDNLDIEFFNQVKAYAVKIHDTFKQYPLYIVTSPFDKTRELIRQTMSIDFTLYDLIKMLFTENLNNLYRSIYNFSQILRIAPQYVEQLPPVEKDLLWSYHIRDEKDAEMRKSMNTKTGSFQP